MSLSRFNRPATVHSSLPSPRTEMADLGALWVCLQLVGATCGLCGRSPVLSSLCDGSSPRKERLCAAAPSSPISGSPLTPRPYEDHRAYCLFYSKGKCKKMHRPAVQPVPSAKPDTTSSNAGIFLFDVVADYAKARFGLTSYGCGLCQTGIPCESGIPTERSLKDFLRRLPFLIKAGIQSKLIGFDSFQAFNGLFILFKQFL